MKLLLIAAVGFTSAWTPPTGLAVVRTSRRTTHVACKQTPPPDLEEVTEKYGLEAGLFSALKRAGQDDDSDGEKKSTAMATAGDLLKRYGGAYLLTSTSLALVSFTFCYLAVSNGVDIASLLSRVGIEASSTSETAGTVGIAYALHKAASPIRFPPTVALTPIIARSVFGKSEEDEASDGT